MHTSWRGITREKCWFNTLFGMLRGLTSKVQPKRLVKSQQKRTVKTKYNGKALSMPKIKRTYITPPPPPHQHHHHHGGHTHSHDGVPCTDPSHQHDHVPAEDIPIVFEITQDNFQSFVLQSPSPTIIECYIPKYVWSCLRLNSNVTALSAKHCTISWRHK